MGLNKKVKEHSDLLRVFNAVVMDLDKRIKVLEAKLAKEENKGVAH
jgi:hypothetical protein